MEIILTKCQVRNWRLSDVKTVSRYANNFKIWLNLRDAFPHPYRQKDARNFIRRALSLEPQTMFAICLDQEAIGSIGFRLHQDVERVSAEIGYWLGEPFWNRGIMTDVLTALTEYAIDAHRLTRIFAVPFEWNLPSFRVLEKAEYVMEGRMKKSAIKNGRVIDQLLYAYTI
jgi:RimJ/RimL family protein N-acetyltransferase